MALRAPVKPEFFRWACERGSFAVEDLSRRSQLKRLPEWVSGKSSPTLKQLEAFAKATYVPVGYFFMEKPPVEDIPIPDLRTIGNKTVSRPSPDLLDTIYLCERRQDWYRDYLLSQGEEPLDFVASAKMSHSVEKTAERMRKELGFDLDERQKARTWEEALRLFVKKVEEARIMVMFNGIVANNTRRKLDVGEFRGFAMSDDLVPLIFINGSDSKSAQMFTLAHELAHIWLGESALSDTALNSLSGEKIEVWCNRVAAEFLVPLEHLKKNKFGPNPLVEVPDISRKYKVSSLVIIRRLFDAGFIGKKRFNDAYKEELSRIKKIPNRSGGGDFYKMASMRTGRRFAYDVIASTLEGNTTFTEAFRLLEIKRLSTFDGIQKELEIVWK